MDNEKQLLLDIRSGLSPSVSLLLYFSPSPSSSSTTALCNHLTRQQRGPGLAYQWRNSQISNTPSLGASGISALATPHGPTSSAQRRAATSTKGIPSYRLHVSMSALCVCIFMCVRDEARRGDEKKSGNELGRGE